MEKTFKHDCRQQPSARKTLVDMDFNMVLVIKPGIIARDTATSKGGNLTLHNSTAVITSVSYI